MKNLKWIYRRIQKLKKAFGNLSDFLFGYDYFIAHRSVDGKNYAAGLHEELTDSANLDCFLDTKHYDAGGKLIYMQSRALRKTTRLIVLVTNRAHDDDSFLLGEIREFKRIHPNGKIVPIGTSETLSIEIFNSSALLKLIPKLPHDICILEDEEALSKGKPSGDTVIKLINDFQEQRKSTLRSRFLQATTVIFIGLTITSVMMFFQAQEKQKLAEKRLDMSVARLLASRANDANEKKQFHLGLLLSRESLKKYPTIDADRALRAALGVVPNYVGKLVHSVSGPDDIDAITVSHDGKYIATSSGATVTRGGKVKVWQLSDLKEVSLNHLRVPGPAYFSPTENLLITGSRTHIMSATEIPSGKIRYTAKHKGTNVEVQAISPDGLYVVTKDYDVHKSGAVISDNILNIINLRTGEIVKTAKPLSTIGFSHGESFFFQRNGSTYLAARWGNGGTEVWLIAGKGDKYQKIPGALSYDGKLALIFEESKNGFKVVDAYKSDIITVSGNEQIRHFQFNRDGRFLALSDWNSNVQVWDLHTKERLNSNKIQEFADNIIFSSDGRYLASKRSNKVWYLDTGHIASENYASERETSQQSLLGDRITDHATGQISRDDPAFAMSFSPDSKDIYTVDRAGNVFIWGAYASSYVAEIKIMDETYDARISPDGRNVASVSLGKLRYWDFDKLSTLKNSKRFLLSLTFSKDGEYLAYGTGAEISTREPSGINVLNIRKNTSKHFPFDSTVRTLEFSSDGTHLAVGASAPQFSRNAKDWGLTILNLQNDTRKKLETDEISFYQVKFHPTKPWIAYAGSFGSKIIDLKTEKVIVNTGWANGIDFSHDGKIVALQNRENVWLLSLEPGREEQEEIARFAIDGEPTSLNFDATSGYLAIGTRTQGVGVWDWHSEREVARIPMEQEVIRVEFNPADPNILMVAGTHQVNFSYWEPENLIKKSKSRVLRELTSAEWKRYAGDTYFKDDN